MQMLCSPCTHNGRVEWILQQWEDLQQAEVEVVAETGESNPMLWSAAQIWLLLLPGLQACGAPSRVPRRLLPSTVSMHARRQHGPFCTKRKSVPPINRTTKYLPIANRALNLGRRTARSKAFSNTRNTCDRVESELDDCYRRHDHQDIGLGR